MELHDPDDERVINGDYVYSHSRDYEVGDGVHPNQEIDNISMIDN